MNSMMRSDFGLNANIVTRFSAQCECYVVHECHVATQGRVCAAEVSIYELVTSERPSQVAPDIPSIIQEI